MAYQKFDEDNCLCVNSSATVGVASAQVLAANDDRVYLLVQNNGSSPVYVTYGAQAATTALGVKIPPGDAYEPRKVSGQAVNMISDGAGQAVVLIEGTAIDVGAS